MLLRFLRTLIAAVVLFVPCGLMKPALAQSAIEIVLRDAQSGTPVAGHKVVLENADTGYRVEAVTDARGTARFGGLQTAGSWIAHASGDARHAPAQSPAVALRTGFERSLVMLLQPAHGLEEIATTASRIFSGLNRTNAEISASFGAAEIEHLPVEGRSLDRVLFRLPNVTQATGFFNEAPAVAINGANSLFTNYMIDGLDNNENFLGGMRFPIPVGAIEDVTVLASNYSAEFGRTANGIVNVTTKSGGNEIEGEAFFVTRPGGALGSQNGFNPRDLSGNPVSSDFRRYQAGFAVGGPIVADKSFYFANLEYTRDETTNILSASALGVADRIGGRNDFLLGTLRLDQRWTDRLSSSFRFNRSQVTLERPGGGLTGGIVFPSAGSEQTRRATNVAFETRMAGEDWNYRAALQYARFAWNFGKPLTDTDSPQVTLLDPSGRAIATLGHPGFVFDETENNFQFQQKVEIERGRHRLSFGSDLIIADFGLKGGGNANGNFTLMLDDAGLAALRAAGLDRDFDIDDIPTGIEVVAAQFETAPGSFGTDQRQFGLFAEDRVMLTPDLAVTLGLRWDYDSLSKGASGSGDLDNIAPRLGLNWSFRDDMAFRAGAGLFYEKIPYAVVSDALQFSTDTPGFRAQLATLIEKGLLPADADIERMINAGTRAVDIADLCSGFGNCPSPSAVFGRRAELASAELRILNPEGYDNPYAFQASLGWQWELRRGFRLSIDGLLSEGRNLVRLRDLNAPAPFAFNFDAFAALGPAGVAALTDAEREALGLIRSQAAANATRPAAGADGGVPQGGARSIIVSETRGRARYRALTVTIEKERLEDDWSFLIAYTLSRLRNNTDDINFRANDANDFAADYGPSLNDRRHVLSALFSVFPLDGLSLSLAGLFQSGQPVNFVPDARVFGTTDLNGDGLSFADQFTGNPDRAPGFSRNSGRLPFASTLDLAAAWEVPVAFGRFELRADVFNLLDTNNESGFPVSFTSSNQIQTAGEAFIQRSAAPARTAQLTARWLF